MSQKRLRASVADTSSHVRIGSALVAAAMFAAMLSPDSPFNLGTMSVIQ